LFLPDKKFEGERLKIARQLRGLTLTELAKKTGISKQSLSLYENSKIAPSCPNMERLATELRFPQVFFSQKDRYRTRTDVTYFRSLSTTTKIDRTAQSIKLEFVAKMYKALLDYIDFPAINLLDNVEFKGTDDEFDFVGNASTQEQIEKITSKLRAHWRVGDAPIANLQFLLEKNGIIVTGFDTEEDKIDAFSQCTHVNDNDMFFIALSIGKRPEGRIRFDMAHELGHILLHPWSEDIEMITKEEFKAREKQANMFASAFLLPKTTFEADVGLYANKLTHYLYLKKKWHMSVQAMVYRTHQLGLITNTQFQYLMRQISQRGWRTREPDDTPFNLNENIFQGAIELLINERILSAASIMRLFSNYGVTMERKDIEELLHLRKGTLQSQETKGQIIKLKGSSNPGV
jgi:Zn-dependent peptidase ImmA (M78 family)/transcriptional regulator with XRE-family HTH domain